MPGNTPKERLESFSRVLDDTKIDSAIISDPKSIFYLTGFSTYKSRINTILLIDRQDGEPVLFVGQTEEKAARDVFVGKLEVYTDYDLKNGRMIVNADAFTQLAGGLLRTAKLGSTVGIEDWHLPQVFVSLIERRWVGISKAILSMRKRKGKDEIAHHEQATRRLDRTFQAVKEYPRTGKTELQLYRHVNSVSFQIEGAPEHWRYSNVAGDFVAGDRTLETGGPATENRMKRGDTLILDLQASANHYWADTARTFMVGSEPTPKQERIFRTLLLSKRNGEEVLRPGTKGSEVYEVVSRTITEAGFDPLPHHAGHGIGLDGQEAPFFVPASHDIIEQGDICALEPGIYDRESGGMRIEDDYVITEDGFKKTSHFPMEL